MVCMYVRCACMYSTPLNVCAATQKKPLPSRWRGHLEQVPLIWCACMYSTSLIVCAATQKEPLPSREDSWNRRHMRWKTPGIGVMCVQYIFNELRCYKDTALAKQASKMYFLE
jgi:hypothetical protein